VKQHDNSVRPTKCPHLTDDGGQWEVLPPILLLPRRRAAGRRGNGAVGGVEELGGRRDGREAGGSLPPADGTGVEGDCGGGRGGEAAGARLEVREGGGEGGGHRHGERVSLSALSLLLIWFPGKSHPSRPIGRRTHGRPIRNGRMDSRSPRV
jgi:hypothetical protein